MALSSQHLYENRLYPSYYYPATYNSSVTYSYDSTPSYTNIAGTKANIAGARWASEQLGLDDQPMSESLKKKKTVLDWLDERIVEMTDKAFV